MNPPLRSRLRAGALAFVAAGTLGLGGTAIARTPLGAGDFLVAARGQQGIFAHSVILLIAYGSDGAMGLIVNRPTKFPLAKALSDPSGLQGRDNLLYFGGPVSLTHLTLLVRSKTAPPDSIHITNDLYASGSLKTLHAVVTGKIAGASLRAYAGYAGWAPGQLESEITHAGWLVLPANTDDAFTTDPAGLWDKLIQRQNLILVQAAQQSQFGAHRHSSLMTPDRAAIRLW